jgi:hypothetical protein
MNVIAWPVNVIGCITRCDERRGRREGCIASAGYARAAAERRTVHSSDRVATSCESADESDPMDALR